MNKGSDFTSVILVVLFGVFVQIMLISADHRETATSAALEFTEGYFQLDPAIADRLCSDLMEDEENNPVEKYLNVVEKEAEQLGHNMNYMRSTLYSVKAHLIDKDKDDTRAIIEIKAKRKRNINPVFAFVAKIFFLGEVYTVDEKLEMVKEDGKWKVCGAPFDLPV
jgi:hypothetical protein